MDSILSFDLAVAEKGKMAPEVGVLRLRKLFPVDLSSVMAANPDSITEFSLIDDIDVKAVFRPHHVLLTRDCVIFQLAKEEVVTIESEKDFDDVMSHLRYAGWKVEVVHEPKRVYTYDM